jgi:hypothetical protein
MWLYRKARIAVCGLTLVAAFASPARADAVTDWNQVAVRATEIAGAPVPVQTRTMSIVHAAIFDAVNAVDRKYTPYVVGLRAPEASAEVAAAAAAHGILVRLYPPQKLITDAALTATLAKIPDGPPKENGLRIGQEVAEKVFAARKDDGASAQASYAFSSGPGVYQATPPMNIDPILPQWRSVAPFLMTPFTMNSPKQFPFTGPPDVTSAAFAKEFDETKRLGARLSTERTTEQTAIAIHWAGSEVPPFNAIARTVSAAKNLSLIDNARLFALLNMAMADSLIAGFEAKYGYNFWRPVTAIRNAALAKNPALTADANWEPLLVSPPHQEYPSAHCLGAGAAVAVLQAVFGGDSLTASYVYPPLGVVRRWTGFSQIATEVENARIWGGIHYRSAVEHGTAVGRQIGEYAVKSAMQPLVN